MKKALLTLGLFSMMMLLTSFTTAETRKGQITYDQVETGGRPYISPPMKKPDYTMTQPELTTTNIVSSESYNILYRSSITRKVD